MPCPTGWGQGRRPTALPSSALPLCWGPGWGALPRALSFPLWTRIGISCFSGLVAVTLGSREASIGPGQQLITQL